ncbi:phytanoyl-CoA dioxygenase family protein [Curvivirga aplysinae]|uniref:phytanoyl-CoA dioxygenase family protein n=1 Tax=Curvivirga aplysinae TaxID=2529852 RepID=UPI0012BD00F2|nr:phytanoyl-CoA dioxygenase family protein [Curvivirga aplysinae]MTI09972.1 phytanoyl-CoA dioxygenase family protein [Curvivirga aplysinae]
MDKIDIAKLKKEFDQDGFVMIRNGISDEALSRLNKELQTWIEKSKEYIAPYGEMLDGRPRFDLEEKSHSKENPALRRIGAPIEVSDVFLEFVRKNKGLELTHKIFGTAIKLWASKINLKLPNSGTIVKYHQDFPFDPHSNDDMITALFFLDDVTEKNGPLRVVPESHKGPLYSHFQDGIFTGAVDANIQQECREKSVSCIGNAGDICLMHANTLHGSGQNLTDKSRNLLIVTYVAEDAAPLVANPIPHKYDSEIVYGERSGKIRSKAFTLELPEYPKEASFFAQQSKQAN